MHLVMVGGVLAAATGLTLGTEWPVWVDLAIYLWALLFGVLNYATGKPEDRDRIVGFMTRVDGPGLYTRAVDGLLRLLGRMMAPKVRQGPSPEKGLARLNAYLNFEVADGAQVKALMKDPFSWPVGNVALKLAIIYPLLALLLQWAVTNADTGVGGQTILAGSVSWYWRAAVIGPLVFGTSLHIITFAGARDSLQFVAELILAVYFVSTFTLIFALEITGAFVGANTGLLAPAMAIAFAAVASGSFAFAITVTIAGALSEFPSGGIVVAFAIGLAVWSGPGRVALVFFWLAMIGLTTVSISIIQLSNSGDDFRPFLFALALLPLLNAAFDYLSYGTTLTLIRKGWFGQRGPSVRIAVLGAIDAAMALVFLIGLGVTMVAFVALINAYAVAGPLFDLPTVFADLRNPEAGGAYTWLILSCLTTLVPTIVHLLIVALSAFTWVPLRAKLWLAQPVEAGGGDLPVLGSTLAWSLIGLAYCAVVAVGVTGLIWLVRGGIGDLGLVVLDCVEWLSLALRLL
ncbi:hypothetical protein JANAI62_07110 [Jannaschia pagri]|uniref:Uncharacterized protein n=1 Tax=Jannaschia pagri TaxID=2829797 RepID=A0ABQ4NI38_9RHOB|nr:MULTISPECIES: hypothetical protein [unclassified Jannaschia]GIT89804.1 hypothetical protein JANAI61_02620 [Jannaschia sp. AI_61]GIT94088.1 hypothetical protein JANAI62_07110 [Jannaschia sp. AI_62]